MKALLGIIVIVFAFNQARAQETEPVQEREPAQDSAYMGGAEDSTKTTTVVIPKMRRWSLHGQLGFNFNSDPAIVRDSWTYSIIESPMVTIGARIRFNPQSWDHFNFYARTDFVYSQRQWDIQTAFGSSSMNDRQVTFRGFGEASWHPHFAHWLAVFGALGVQSPSLFRSFNLSARGYSTDMLTTSNIGIVAQLSFAYMAGGGLVISLGYDYTNTNPQAYSAVVSGISYGL